MRVLYSFGNKFAGGGVGVVAYHAVRALHARGMLARLLCGARRSTEIPPALIRSIGLPDRALRKLATYDRTRRVSVVQRLVYDAWASRRLEKADVFLPWANSALWSMRRAARMGMPVVLQRSATHPRVHWDVLEEEHGRWGVPFRRPRRAIERSAAEIDRADRVILQAEVTAATYRAEGVPAEKIARVRCGADVRRFRPAEARASGPFRVLFVGQVGLRKGVLYLLEAWRRLGWRDAELHVVGNVDGAMRPLLRAHAARPGVRLFGHVDDPAETFRGADVFALPTLDEDAALVTYEALASGLPLLTTAEAGSVARDGVEGLLVPARDVGALATALERLRADERGRREMARAARSRAEHFTWERYGDDLVATLERLGAEP